MNRPQSLNIAKLRQFAAMRWPETMGATHGLAHWDRVARFGQMLYQEGADMDVVMAFAYLHDSERRNNAIDIEHGKRASAFIDTIRHTQLQQLDDEQIATLKRACELHTTTRRTDNPTINICFDADRMDLLRVGIIPQPERMATPQGARLVDNPDYAHFYQQIVSEQQAAQ